MNFFSTTITEDAINNVSCTLKQTFVSAGKIAYEFEEKLKDTFNLKYVSTVNSGTSALHIAIKMLNLKNGDEIILPSQTFVATGLAVLYERGTPIFADINVFDGNINVDSIKKKISDKTKAIILVDWGGYPCDLYEIIKLSKKLGIKTIHDAAHSLGAKYKNEYIGSQCDYTAFSFQAIKHLTTGDGGALCCLNEDDDNMIKKLRWFGIDRENDKMSFLGERQYNLNDIGFKYHMNDIAASIGLGNIKTITNKLNKINNIAKIYENELINVSGLTLMDYKSDRNSSYWLFPILVENRSDFIKKLKSHDIPSSVVHQGIDRNNIFGGIDNSLSNQRIFDLNQIHIPINFELTDSDIIKIINVIKSGW